MGCDLVAFRAHDLGKTGQVAVNNGTCRFRRHIAGGKTCPSRCDDNIRALLIDGTDYGIGNEVGLIGHNDDVTDYKILLEGLLEGRAARIDAFPA